MILPAAVYGFCTAGVSAGILVLSVIPPLRVESSGVVNSGPWAHVLAYGMLCGCAGMWLRTGRAVRRPLACAALLSAAYGCAIECAQYALPHRNFEVTDILINCCAVLVAAALLRLGMRRARPAEEADEKD